MTKILPIRLTEKEFGMLDEMLASEFCESENRSEMIRLWIHREWNKRKKLGVPKVSDYQTSFRFNGQTTIPLFKISQLRPRHLGFGKHSGEKRKTANGNPS